jgi:glycosidase
LRQYSSEGTFAAFGQSLPRLKDMGVEILWFMPITPIAKEKRQGTLGSYYACSDYISTNPEFGSVEDFAELVRTAHRFGFKVLIDWVANHTGWDHKWTKEHSDFYKKNDEGNFYEAHGWVDVIDLDYENKLLRQEMVDAMKFWVRRCDIDGFRCDMAHLVPLDFWIEARTAIEAEKHLFWLAECEVAEYHYVFDATYTWEFLHKAEAFYRGEVTLKQMEAVLIKYRASFPADALRLFFTTNHDENSHSGSEYERLGHAAKTVAVLCAMWENSIPLIYSGQEIPNTKRLKFFDKDNLPSTRQFLLHSFYKTLLTLKTQHPALRSGDPAVKTIRLKTNEDEKIFAFMRQNEERQVVVILNLSASSRLRIKIEEPNIIGQLTSVFSGVVIDYNDQTSFEMQPWEYLVFAN